MAEGPDQVRRQDAPSEGAREKLSHERDEIHGDPYRTDDELEALRLELARTRAQMSETVYSLQDRANPQYVKEQVREQATAQARDTAKSAGSSVADTIRQNPVPAALAGAGLVGIGWLVASGKSSGSGQPGYGGSSDPYGSSERYYTSYEDRGSEGSSGGSGQERAQEAAQEARQRASQMGGELQNRAQEARGQAQEKAQRAKGGLQNALQENPLALGALALGAGMAVGLSVPGSSKEDELMGETRDKLANQAQQRVQSAQERLQRVAEEARSSAEEEAGRQNLTSD